MLMFFLIGLERYASYVAQELIKGLEGELRVHSFTCVFVGCEVFMYARIKGYLRHQG